MEIYMLEQDHHHKCERHITDVMEEVLDDEL
jgi:hypothetical protein